MESVMNAQQVRLGWLSDCGRLLVRFGRGCKSYIFNDKAEQEWAVFAHMEAVAELRAQQSRAARRRIGQRNR
jgi:hypothetical protein